MCAQLGKVAEPGCTLMCFGGVEVLSRLLANCDGKHQNRNLHGTFRERLLNTCEAAAHLCPRARKYFEAHPGSLRQKFSSVAKFKKYQNTMQSYQIFLASVCERSQENDFFQFSTGGLHKVQHSSATDECTESMSAGTSKPARFSSARATLATATGDFLQRRTKMAGHFVAVTKHGRGRCVVCCHLCESNTHATAKSVSTPIVTLPGPAADTQSAVHSTSTGASSENATSANSEPDITKTVDHYHHGRLRQPDVHNATKNYGIQKDKHEEKGKGNLAAELI